MFHGSAPVLMVFSTTAAKFAKLALLILITVTELPAAFETKANVLFGSSAMLRGSSPTAMVFNTALVSVRITETVSSRELTTQTSRLSSEMAIGLE